MLSELVNIFVLNVAIWLWVAASLVLLWLVKSTRRGLIPAIVFLVIFWLSGTGAVARLVLGPLETAFHQPSLQELQSEKITHVVILTGGGYAGESGLAANLLPHASTLRFVAGLELCQRLGPDCELIYSGSGGTGNEDVKAADTMQALARAIAPPRKMTSDSASNNTAEHPQYVKPIVESAPFALVTSAYHMPRAMMVFQQAGLNAIPFPVDYYTHSGLRWTDLVPSPQNWQALNIALHEYVGMAAYSLQ